MSNKLIGEFINLRNLDTADALLTFNWRSSQRAYLLNAGAASVSDQKKWIKSRPKNEYNFIIELILTSFKFIQNLHIKINKR